MKREYLTPTDYLSLIVIVPVLVALRVAGWILSFAIPVGTAMIGYNIHKSVFWSIIDFIFVPIVWVKWLIFQEVNMTIIKDTFSFFWQ